MTAAAAATPPSALVREDDARAGLLVRLSDDDLLTGHVLTSVAGWGPELEINIALSSMGRSFEDDPVMFLAAAAAGAYAARLSAGYCPGPASCG